MLETIQQINFLLALGGIATAGITALVLFDYHTNQKIKNIIAKWGMLTALLVTVSSAIVTLIYSEIFGLIPCGLCWLERIALYPQVLILLVAIWYKDTLMPRYGIALSSFGLIISLYHHYIQMGGAQFIKCPVSGVGADCAKRFMFEFNFFTFPLLAAVLFAFLIVLYIYLLKVKAD